MKKRTGKKRLALLLVACYAALPLRGEDLWQAASAANPASAAAGKSLDRVLEKTSVQGYIATDWQGGVLINKADQVNGITPNFEQYRFVFGFLSELSDSIVFNSEVEFEHATRVGVKSSTTTVYDQGSGLTKTVLSSASAGLEVEIEQAWLEFRHLPWFRPRVGVILPPVGRLNINHDADTVATVDRPISAQQIIPATWFEPGLGFTGQLELGPLGLAYEAYTINGLRASHATAADESKLRDMRMHKDAANDNNTDKALVGRLALQAFGAELGISGYRGAYDVSSSLYANFGALDALYRLGPLELQGEWVSLSLDKPANFTQTFAGLRQGWYAQMLYSQDVGRFGKLQPYVNVSQVDPDVSRVTSADQTRVTYGLNYRPIDKVVIKFNYADSQYVRGYTNSAGGQSAVLDQRLQASAAWGF